MSPPMNELRDSKTLAAPFIGVARHRIGIDGDGVTTLAAFHGCPLRCRYCLNPSCLGSAETCRTLTPEQLYQEVLIDQLYFLATGGGVCFGGGEPLLRPAFIRRFRELCGPDWQLTVETSLNVPAENLEAVIPSVNVYIVDIKDLDNAVYQSYTGQSNEQVRTNLQRLLQAVGRDRIVVRVPLIPEYNTEEAVKQSAVRLREAGFTRIDCFQYKLPK